MELPQELIEKIGTLLAMLVQDKDFLPDESWYTPEEEVAERRRRVKELGENAELLLGELDPIMLG